ncbi:hypothetical protein ACJQWK_11564 [Exserohilum turcicum]
MQFNVSFLLLIAATASAMHLAARDEQAKRGHHAAVSNNDPPNNCKVATEGLKCKTDSECCPQSFLFCTPMDNTRKCWHHI